MPGAAVSAEKIRFRIKIVAVPGKICFDDFLKCGVEGDNTLLATLAGDFEEAPLQVNV
jgi:hypothetical protein